MVLEEEMKITQSRNAHTQHIVIPAAMVRDSPYPFRADERVGITVDPYRRMMIVRFIEEPSIEVSSEGIYIKGERIEVVEG
jgi:hypothetical protein